MKNVIQIAFVFLVLALGSCKKDKSETPFVADKTIVEVDDSLFINYKIGGNVLYPQSMAFDSLGNSIYFYLEYNSDGSGFQILKYNLTNKSFISVYVNSDTQWKNSNGSEGKRLFIHNKELWIPGGATNDKIVRLTIGDNTLTLLNTYQVGTIDFGKEKGYSPYDIAMINGILYVVTMNDYVFYGNFSTSITGNGSFATGATSHGSSIVSVTIDKTPYLLVKCSDDSKIELRKIDGTFVRSVATNTNNSSQLVKDSKQRVYYYDSNKTIIRYSADLLVKEEFPATNFDDYSGITLKEDNQNITLYCNYNKGLGMVRLPL
jgi:hypothetical protein